MIFVDSHVHIYDCFDVDFLFDSALKNFKAAAEHHKCSQQLSFVLLLTEGVTEDWLNNVLTKIVPDELGERKISTEWSGFYSKETGTLKAYRNDFPEEKIEIVGGRQVVTREKIEVLALFCQKTIAHGLSLEETVSAVEQSGGIPVLPWGVGKWIGKRGGIIKQFLSDHLSKRLFLGDNGGRPLFWSTPAIFNFARKFGVFVLPGTDPLPLPAEAGRVGSYGFYLDEKKTYNDSPAMYLKNVLLSQEEDFVPFGRLLSSRLFFLNQLRLRFFS